MTDEEVLFHYNRMVEIFGDHLPNLEHYPIQFKYYVTLYKKFHLTQ